MATWQSQLSGHQVIAFDDFEGMATQYDRHGLPEKKAAWLENVQPVGPNNLLTVPAPQASQLASLAGETIVKQYYFNFGSSVDYVINFCASGAAYAVTNPGGATTKFANAGTFSSTPDATQLGTSRLLIADAQAGYCTWDTRTFVRQGGISPNVNIISGGAGYTSQPSVTVSGGSGTGAVISTTVSGGIIATAVLSSSGSGYVATDIISVVVTGGGASTTASLAAHIWPIFATNPQTIAYFSGRVWLAATNIINYSGTGAAATYGGNGYDDFTTADAAGSTTINDPDLIHNITALRALNNYLFIVGDNSVKQIGNVSVTGTTTNFTTVTLTSDNGTTFRDTILSYNRLMLFANKVGVYAVFGSSVQKISEDMDGIFRAIDFTQNPVAAVNDINNIHCFLLLARYQDPAVGTRSLILAFAEKKWFVISQGNALRFLTTANIGGQSFTMGTSGSDVTRILFDPTLTVSIKIQTALTAHGAIWGQKRSIRWATVQNTAEADTITLTIESEKVTQAFAYSLGSVVTWVNATGGVIQWQNAALQNVNWTTGGYTYKTQQVNVSGNYLGATLTGTVKGYTFIGLALEYEQGPIFAGY